MFEIIALIIVIVIVTKIVKRIPLKAPVRCYKGVRHYSGTRGHFSASQTWSGSDVYFDYTPGIPSSSEICTIYVLPNGRHLAYAPDYPFKYNESECYGYAVYNLKGDYISFARDNSAKEEYEAKKKKYEDR